VGKKAILRKSFDKIINQRLTVLQWEGMREYKILALIIGRLIGSVKYKRRKIFTNRRGVG